MQSQSDTLIFGRAGNGIKHNENQLAPDNPEPEHDDIYDIPLVLYCFCLNSCTHLLGCPQRFRNLDFLVPTKRFKKQIKCENPELGHDSIFNITLVS